MASAQQTVSPGAGDAGAMSGAQLDPELVYKYERCVRKGKEEAKAGNLLKSIDYFQRADTIQPSEKLKGRILKLETALQRLNIEQDDDADDDEFVEVLGSGLMLYKEMFDKLYEHQKEGVAFLYSLYRDGKRGGILADDMGLGKTIQVISFLSGMFDAELIKTVLLIMPTTLISIWERELQKWTPGMMVNKFHGTSERERTKDLQKIQRRGGIIISTYQMMLNNWQQVSSYNGAEFVWDYIILDEAHKIKVSTTKTAKACAAIPAKNRVLLTGTPVQNNLREMWALYDFACQGTLLGTAKTFKMEYENPITRARERDATPGEKALGLKISENLMKIIQPYFLRRTKQDVQNKTSSKGKMVSEVDSKTLTMPSLTRKNDFILWVYLSPVQEEIYKKFISLDEIKELLTTTKSPLAHLTILKTLCDHPRLLSARACVQLGLEGDEVTSTESYLALEADEMQKSDLSSVSKFDHLSDEILIKESGKLELLLELLHKLRDEGHKTLVFSRSRKMLDMIARILENRRFKIMRIDGTVTLLDREKRIQMFQSSANYSVLLLTTQVGGVGLTLTAANRVVIFDPSWNPATDSQAVDRAYRIGQQANVVIYRLITCGTVEEKIYRRQIFKDSLIRQTTGDKKNPFRYFSKQELKELFSLEDTQTSTTQIQLQNMHSSQRKTDAGLDEHIAFLHSLNIFGMSDHDLLYTQECSSQDEECRDEDEEYYINNRVQKAHELVQMESQMNQQLMEHVSSASEGAWLRQNVAPEKPEARSLPSAKPQVPPELVDLTEDLSSVSCQMNSMIIEEPSLDSVKRDLSNEINGQASVVSDDPAEENAPQLTTNTTANERNCHMTSLITIDSDEEVLPPAPFKVEPENSFRTVEAFPALGLKDDLSLLHSNPGLRSGLHGTERSTSDAAHLEQFHLEEEGMSFNEAASLPLLDSQVICDFNLELEDSTSLASPQAQSLPNDSVMESSLAQEREPMLLLEDSTEEYGLGRSVEQATEDANSQRPLQTENSFQHHSVVSHGVVDSVGAETDDEEIIHNARRRVARISSDSEDESFVLMNETEQDFSPYSSPSAKAISASTPKLERSLTDKLFGLQNEASSLRRRSTASRRSLIHIAVEEAIDLKESITESSEEDISHAEAEEAAEELPSDEQADFLAQDAAFTEPKPLCLEDYSILVQRGKELKDNGHIKESLDCFLKALDIKSGDPEVMMITLNLYKELS
ncbi:DNA excision repair protein ERCC-6-like isoform X2 [Hyperolius riggenbachi]|uniref:DNA excision repair protein ERCC-6-like isoform X2 n=1 Tax=Hyperolius riggenbachi TaxID=752182 RepID=UPI0035A32E90